MIQKYTDNTKMPFGGKKGTLLENIPDSYFKWFWTANNNNDWYRALKQAPTLTSLDLQNQQKFRLMEYIEDNFENL